MASQPCAIPVGWLLSPFISLFPEQRTMITECPARLEKGLLPNCTGRERIWGPIILHIFSINGPVFILICNLHLHSDLLSSLCRVKLCLLKLPWRKSCPLNSWPLSFVYGDSNLPHCSRQVGHVELISYIPLSFLPFPHPNVVLSTSLEKAMNFSITNRVYSLLTSSACLWVYKLNSPKNVRW